MRRGVRWASSVNGHLRRVSGTLDTVAVHYDNTATSTQLLEEFNNDLRQRYREEPGAYERDAATDRSLLSTAASWAYLAELIDLSLSSHEFSQSSGDTTQLRVDFVLSSSTLQCYFGSSSAVTSQVLSRCRPTSHNNLRPGRSLTYLTQVSDRPQFYTGHGSFTFGPLDGVTVDSEDGRAVPRLSGVHELESLPQLGGVHAVEQCSVLLSLRNRTAEDIWSDFHQIPPELIALHQGNIAISMTNVSSNELSWHTRSTFDDTIFVQSPNFAPRQVLTASDGVLSYAVLPGDESRGQLVRIVPEATIRDLPGWTRGPWEIGPNGVFARSKANFAMLERARQLAAEVQDAPLMTLPTPPTAEHKTEPVPSSAGQTLLTGDLTDSASDAERVLAIIGRNDLLERLPAGLASEMEKRQGPLSDITIAELALAVHGVEILKKHKDVLRLAFDDVPQQWAGGDTAIHWVSERGFSPDFAGFPKPTRQAFEKVPGPPNLPALHDYQRDAVREIRDLLRSGSGRGLLSLPTGAGKTRTATHALVEAMREGELEGPIIWVAENDELCEQAADAWEVNWRQIGPNAQLVLCRFWGDNDVENHFDRYQVVIATEAKLRSSFINNEDREWLSRANALVVDEAHRGVAPTFTALLRELGMDHRTERVPVIGLSATPYRNTDEERTKQLIRRFGSHRFDDLGNDPYDLLQGREILAQVEQRTIDGVALSLSTKEKSQLEQMHTLPASVLKRVGKDRARNQAILQSFIDHPDDLPALLFAASVEQAELLAGLLSVEGIRARSITGKTSKGARRHYVGEFRRGDVKVLTNYAVLTEGFDAPAARSVYIVRPTYSWNLYQQMIGRGLRGPLNGGSATCTIVNVADNLDRYGLELAYREFEHMWGGGNSEMAG